MHPSQICCCDTDSVAFLYDPENADHKYPSNSQSDMPESLRFGNGLGKWEDEFKGDYIKEWVACGAKSYAYVTGKGKVAIKQKGITMDMANSKKVNFESLKQLVLNHDPAAKIDSESRYTFKWDEQAKDIVPKFISRSIKCTVQEKNEL
jgi:hypothetical protein